MLLHKMHKYWISMKWFVHDAFASTELIPFRYSILYVSMRRIRALAWCSPKMAFVLSLVLWKFMFFLLSRQKNRKQVVEWGCAAPEGNLFRQHFIRMRIVISFKLRVSLPHKHRRLFINWLGDIYILFDDSNDDFHNLRFSVNLPKCENTAFQYGTSSY